MSDETTTPEEAAPQEVEVEVAAPRDERLEALLERFTHHLGDSIVDSHIVVGKDLWIRVATDAWRAAAEVARNDLHARYFGFLSGIDWMESPYGRSMDSEVDRILSGEDRPGPGPIEQGYAGGETRFQVFARVAHIGEPNATWGVTLKADVPDDPFEVESWTSVFAGADWHERECHEMFGIGFVGHPGLRHMYLPSDFEGYPLRKDFPLVARQVKPWPGIVDVEAMPEVPAPDAPAGAPDGATDATTEPADGGDA
ncbi:MAG: NADH-quinone oxidoreductase subunit C [Microthrixaceae bacterium]